VDWQASADYDEHSFNDYAHREEWTH